MRKKLRTSPLRCVDLLCDTTRVGCCALVCRSGAAHLEVDEEVRGVLDVIVFAHFVLQGPPGAAAEALSMEGSRGIQGAGGHGAGAWGSRAERRRAVPAAEVITSLIMFCVSYAMYAVKIASPP